MKLQKGKKMIKKKKEKKPKKFKNEIVKYDTYAEIILYHNSTFEEKARTIIDLDDLKICSNYIWCITADGYAVTSGKINDCHNRILMHRLILGLEKNDGKIGDHINGNRLDNRKINLRIVTPAQNSMNRPTLLSSNTSGVTGVSWNKRQRKWHSYIWFNKKRIHLGYFENLDEAVDIRLKAEVTYFKEYAPIHNILK